MYLAASQFDMKKEFLDMINILKWQVFQHHRKHTSGHMIKAKSYQIPVDSLQDLLRQNFHLGKSQRHIK